MEYYVYKHTVPDGRVYIGITCQKPIRRWNSGYGYYKIPFFDAIMQYGWRNIVHEIIATGLTKDEAYTMERELIAQYDATNPEKGFNQRKAAKGSNTGITHTEEWKANQSKRMKGMFTGKYVEGRSHKAKRVDQYTTDGEYIKTWDSTTQIQRRLGIHYTNIVKCCTKVYKSAGDFLWCYEGEDISEAVSAYNKPKHLSEEHKARIAQGMKAYRQEVKAKIG